MKSSREVNVDDLKKEAVEEVYKGELTGEEMQKLFRLISKVVKKNASKGVL